MGRGRGSRITGCGLRVVYDSGGGCEIRCVHDYGGCLIAPRWLSPHNSRSSLGPALRLLWFGFGLLRLQVFREPVINQDGG
jgi:hypothetical protein